MNVLAIGAHPDDVELGCFGTLLEMKRQGHGAFAVALCPGPFSGHRLEEITKAWTVARDLLREGQPGGDYVLGEFPNGALDQNWESVGFVDKLIADWGIDTVITHHYGEAHQDHLSAQKIAVSAARKEVDQMWLWESSIYTHRNILPFRPQLYVSISEDSFKGKMRALESYLKAGLLEQGEVDAHRHLARYRGAELRRDLAEAFELVWQVRE